MTVGFSHSSLVEDLSQVNGTPLCFSVLNCKIGWRTVYLPFKIIMRITWVSVCNVFRSGPDSKVIKDPYFPAGGLFDIYLCLNVFLSWPKVLLVSTINFIFAYERLEFFLIKPLIHFLFKFNSYVNIKSIFVDYSSLINDLRYIIIITW